MGSPADARAFTRLPSDVEVELESASGFQGRFRVANLSLRGLWIEASTPLAPGDEVWVHLWLAAEAPPVDAGGPVVRSDERGLAVRFDELPYESLGPLVDWLRAHADDPDGIDDEILDRLGR